jgi:hypothetical protein
MDAPVVLTVADSGAVSWQRFVLPHISPPPPHPADVLSGALSDDNYVRDPVSGFRVAVSR